MLYRMIVAVGALALSAAAPVPTAPQAGDFPGRLAELRTPLRVGDRGLSGPGAAILERAVRDARYVLIGEDHLSREIPLFTADICRSMAPGGMRAMAVEIGPEAASVVDGALRQPNRLERIGAFMRSHPDAMAFQNGRDESDMASACAKVAGPGFRLWGLDQEFFGAAGHLFERMQAARPGPVARQAIERLMTFDRAATAAALASGSPGKLLIYAISDTQFDAARRDIAKDGGPRVIALFSALEETRAVYLGQNGDGYGSNGRRAMLMKRTLTTYLGASKGNPRILFKFGDVHMAKGINALGQRDLGNFVAERAEGEGSISLHLLVLGQRGVHALYDGVGRQVRQEPFVLSDDPDYAWLKEAVPGGPTATTDWTLIDLRPLRGLPPPGMPAAWKRLAGGFDMIVVAPELTPSSLVGTRPNGG